jgi:hypothetical protein
MAVEASTELRSYKMNILLVDINVNGDTCFGLNTFVNVLNGFLRN